MSELEQLKKLLIVSEDEYQKEKLPELVKKLLNYCKISSAGAVIFTESDLSNIKKIKLILVARFLGSKLEEEIKPGVSVDELQDFAGLERNIVQARLSDLDRINFFNRDGNGNYVVKAYQMQNVFDELSGEQPKVSLKSMKQKNRRTSRKGVPLRANVENLIETGWFTDFKTVTDVLNYFKTKKAQTPSFGGTQTTLNRLVRSEFLEREKNKSGKKTIYYYRKRNDADHVIKKQRG